MHADSMQGGAPSTVPANSPQPLCIRTGGLRTPFSAAGSVLSASTHHFGTLLGHEVADDDADAIVQLGQLEDMERFAARLVHSFPLNPAGQV
jgi:hypothetical protein